MGYACFGPHPLTQGTYDLYWIVVDPVAQGHGIGHALLAGVEAEVLARGGRLLLVETSSTSAYASARRLYETAYVIKLNQPDKAISHCQTVMKMVKKDNYAYGRCKKLISKLQAGSGSSGGSGDEGF